MPYTVVTTAALTPAESLAGCFASKNQFRQDSTHAVTSAAKGGPKMSPKKLSGFVRDQIPKRHLFFH
jgi:hypothetical protein